LVRSAESFVELSKIYKTLNQLDNYIKVLNQAAVCYDSARYYNLATKCRDEIKSFNLEMNR